MLLIILSLVLLLVAVTAIFMQQVQFGKTPDKETLLHSPNYRNGAFGNLSLTPQLAEGHSILGLMYKQFTEKVPNRQPQATIPTVKTDLLNLPAGADVLVWFGHSSYFIQLDGKRILVDPVFSGSASPVPGFIKAFAGTDAYSVDDLPDIDYLFITHDHYDHLDYETVKALQPRVGKLICGLGVGSHLKHWGYKDEQLIEGDWNDELPLGDGFRAFVRPTRHFSGRGFKRNNTLWCAYVLESPSLKIYLGGDSGYGSHFLETGDKFGPIDLAILENGQYNEAWRYIHSMPDEVIKEAQELKAKRFFPVHHSKFALGRHSWHEPLDKISALNEQAGLNMITPMIGEPVYLKDEDQQFTRWWRNVPQTN